MHERTDQPGQHSADSPVPLQWFAQSRQALILLWALYIVPRLLILLIPVKPMSDADWYYTRAESLAAGLGYLSNHGEPTAFWPPGWPMALSGAFSLFGTSPLTVGLFNLLCGLLSAWLTLDIGRKLFGSEAAGRAALLLLAIYPNNIGYFPLALTETFYTALLLSICWLLVVRRGWLAFTGAGLLLGVASLVKAQSLAVVPLILLIEIFRAPNFWRQVPISAFRFAALIGLAAMVIAPWSIRNQRELGAFVAVSSNGGVTLLTGNNDNAKGDYSPDDPVYKALNDRGLGELAHDAEAKRLGIAWIKENPQRFVTLIPMKIFRLWGPDGEADWAFQAGYAHYEQHKNTFFAVRLLNQAYYVALMIGFAVAAIVMIMYRRKRGEPVVDWWLLPYGIALYPTAIAAVFSGQSRFHYPVMPFVCMACGWLVIHWLRKRSTSL